MKEQVVKTSEQDEAEDPGRWMQAIDSDGTCTVTLAALSGLSQLAPLCPGRGPFPPALGGGREKKRKKWRMRRSLLSCSS